jgi:hypothetical protein
MEQVSVSVCEANFDTFLSVVDMNGNVIAYNDDHVECAPQSALSFDATGLGPVHIIVEGWGSLSGDYTIQINSSYVGLEEQSANVFNAYPNPSKGSLNLTGNSGVYQLFHINGQLLRLLDTQDASAFDLKDLEGGVYLLKNTKTGQVQKWQKI